MRILSPYDTRSENEVCLFCSSRVDTEVTHSVSSFRAFEAHKNDLTGLLFLT